ncbi:unnamed protein product [Brassicogethes aeneus]|uniref:Cuticle protein n=1 Tax=Brassicogethes aeneus TaxID=1431903 RepID=A0A9P0FL23_BRAAE|nr:unnamed protein product [Brassicogethes aeneus]
MKFLVALLIASACARPGATDIEVSQDTAGNYKYTVKGDNQHRAEERLADGTVLGSYSYVDSNGELQSYKYEAGPQGFKILEGALPVAPLPVEAEPIAPEVPVAETVPVVAPVAHGADVPQFNSIFPPHEHNTLPLSVIPIDFAKLASLVAPFEQLVVPASAPVAAVPQFNPSVEYFKGVPVAAPQFATL